MNFENYKPKFKIVFDNKGFGNGRGVEALFKRLEEK